MTKQNTFEDIWENISNLTSPKCLGERETFWVLPRILGLAKSAEGAVEIFLPGPKLHPKTAVVRRHLEHARWEIESSGEQIDASRILLPSADHFLAMAALIAFEFVRNGLSTKPLQEVMNVVEPIIELALRRGSLNEDLIIGLIGELLCLEAMLSSIKNRPELRMAVLDMWQGFRHGARDFRIGSTAIEVKTTRHEGSSHLISGLHQIEINQGSEESQLFLFSVGLAASEHEGQSLPEITQRIVEMLEDECFPNNNAPLQMRFLEDVASYGDDQQSGYDHFTMSRRKVYLTRYRATFTPRLYDLQDPEMKIVRTGDVLDFFINPHSVQYQLTLPEVVNGANPVASWRHCISSLLSEYSGGE